MTPELVPEDARAEVGPGLVAEVEVVVQEDPLRIEFLHQGKLLTTVGNGEENPFYLKEQGGAKEHLTGPVTVEEQGTSTTIKLRTEDGRPAVVTIQPEKEGALQIHCRVEGQKEGENFGIVFEVTEEEGFYGLMERVVGGMQDYSWVAGMKQGLNLRGLEVALVVLPTVSVYSPFFVSSLGYGIYVESDWPGTYDFGAFEPARLKIEYEGPAPAFRIIPGPLPIDATKRYARTVGTTIVPPKWAFGPWRWRDEHWDLPEFYDGTPYDGPFNSMVVEDVLMMEALGIPCTLYWVDRPWCPGPFGYDDLAWDFSRLPQAQEMVQWLASRDIKFMLWIAPWVDGKMAAEAISKGYNLDPEFPSSPDSAKLLDLTNPEAVGWWQDALGKLIADGVVGFKLDRGEEKVPHGLLVQGDYHDGRSYREVHNAYPALYAEAVHGAFVKADLEEFVVMPRSGWVGTSSHAVVWGGDTAGTEWGLRSAIIAVQRAAMINFPIWGSDTCGYHHTAKHEVCARWLAFSAFTPLMEVGPTDDASLWSMIPDGVSGGVGANGYDYEPLYDESLLAVWNFYANLHYDLMDYGVAQAQLSAQDGTPFVRPMVAMHPDMPEYLDMFDQYYYGPDIWVAPVWEPGVTQREVLVPPGEWMDAWTGKTVDSGKLTVDTPEHKIPIYVRAGTGVDLGDLNARWAAALEKASNVPDLTALAAAVSLP